VIGEKEIGVLESKSVWELYLDNSEFRDRVSVIDSPFNSPVQSSFAVMDGEVPGFIPQPGDLIVPVASDKPDPRSGKPDYERFLKYHMYQPKLPGVIPGNIMDYFVCALSDEEGHIHASDFVKSLENGKEIHRFIPNGINPDDVRMRLGFDPSENQSLPGSLQRVGNEFNESVLFSMVEDLLLEGDWQPIAKRRLDAAQKRLLDLGPQKPGKPFTDPRPIRKSNAFFAKEEVNNDNPDTSPITEEELEEISLAGAVEGAPGNILDPEDERKTT
jgi:hypothetical protein